MDPETAQVRAGQVSVESAILTQLTQRKVEVFAVSTIEMDQFSAYGVTATVNLAFLSVFAGAAVTTLVQALATDLPWWIPCVVALPCIPFGWTQWYSRKRAKGLVEAIKEAAAGSSQTVNPPG